MRDLNHLILTRFNLPSGGHERVVRAQEGWLRGRVQLFERYCLPSVLNQSCRDFQWIVYFDPQSPSWLLEHIEAWRKSGALVPKFRATVSRPELLADIRSVIGKQRRTLLTTNLDNDDGLAIDFVERLQAEPWSNGRMAFYLGNGLIKQDARIYLRRDADNAFCSVRESWDAPLGCWAAPHNHLQSLMPMRSLAGPPAWLQVIHGTNVSNRVHGRLAAPARYASLFPGLLDDACEPSALNSAIDLLASRPLRLAREKARGLVKRSVHHVFGRDGLDRVKLLWTKATGKTPMQGGPASQTEQE